MSTTKTFERRRCSNNLADLNGDQKMNYFLSWFTHWSDLQKSDFLPVLAANMSGDLSDQLDSMRVNGMPVAKKPPLLFDCQLKLFREWFSGWSDDQKNYLAMRLQDVDSDFYVRYEAYESGNPRRPTKDYFEPGVPPELVRKSSRSALAASSGDCEYHQEDFSTTKPFDSHHTEGVHFDEDNPRLNTIAE